MGRVDKTNYYLNIAEDVAKRGTCIRRNYGAVIVKDDEIISTGYTGAVRGAENCCDIGTCLRDEQNIPHGERYELCRSVHAEANAIIEAPRYRMIGSILYLAGIDAKTGKLLEKAEPCEMCSRLIANAGISKVIGRKSDGSYYERNIALYNKNNEALSRTSKDSSKAVITVGLDEKDCSLICTNVDINYK